jgi:hypothetical protein
MQASIREMKNRLDVLQRNLDRVDVHASRA